MGFVRAVRNWFARTIAVAMSVAAEPMPEPLVLSAAPWTLPDVKAKWAMRSVQKLVDQGVTRGVSGAVKTYFPAP